MPYTFPKELDSFISDGSNMSGFVPLFYSIAKDFKKKFRVILEIGVRLGVSTNAFLYGIRDRGHRNLRLYSMDIVDCSGVVTDDNLKKNWTFLQGDSKNIIWEKEIDVLFIDGDHSYEGVKADYERYEPFVKEGGLILFHDVLWHHKGVEKFFWESVDYPKTVLPLSPSGLGVVYKKTCDFYFDDKIKKYITT